MKKFLLITFISVFASNALDANTGIFLIFGDKFDFYSPVNFNTNNIDLAMEFNIDLGDGFWGLKVDPNVIGYDGVNNTPIKKLFRVYDSKSRKLSPFSSKWLDEQNGMRFYYLPSVRYETDLFFVVNEKTLEVNYNATFGFGGIFQDWGQSILDPVYHSCENDHQFVQEQNREEGIYTVRVMTKTGTSRVSNAPRDCYWGARHDENDLYHYFPAQRNVEHRVLNRLFGVKMNSNELIPLRLAFNFYRLRFAVFSESTRFFLNGNTDDLFTIQGDKLVLYKEFPAGLHNVTVETPDFDLPACNPTSFNLDYPCLVKLWFYADQNPNKLNLKVEYPAVALKDKFPNALFVPKPKTKYLINSYVVNPEAPLFLTNLNGDISLHPLMDHNLASNANTQSHVCFLTKHDKPGLGLAKHGLSYSAIYSAFRYNELSGVPKLWGYSDLSSGMNEQSFSYAAKTYESFINKTFIISRVSESVNEDLYTIKNESGLALTNDGTSYPKFASYSENDQRQWWRLMIVPDNVPSDNQNVMASQYDLFVLDRTLHINKLIGDERIEIYLADGKLILCEKTSSSSFSVTLNAGSYIVKIGNNRTKVLIK